MKIRCINENSGLVLNEIYQVVIIHNEGYELNGDTNRYNPSHFETIEENQDELFIQIYGISQEEYLNTFGELPE